MARAAIGLVLLLVLFACKTERKSKNDDIAACNASGGYWKEGGCNDNGHCEKSTGIAPTDEDEMEDDDEDDANL